MKKIDRLIILFNIHKNDIKMILLRYMNEIFINIIVVY